MRWMASALLGLLAVWMAIPTPAARAHTIPTCTVAQLSAGTCAPAREGTRVHITNGNAAIDADCATTTGAFDVVCEYDGSNWVTTQQGGNQAASVGATQLVENAVDADQIAAMMDKVILCGQLVDAGSVQTWVGPSVATYLAGGGDSSIGGTICNALDSETSSAAADAPIDAGFPAFKVTGMQCIISAQPTNDVTIVLHSAAAVLTPTITCTITGGADTGCSTTTSTTTDVAAGATISAEINYTEDLDAQDIWCQVYIAIK